MKGGLRRRMIDDMHVTIHVGSVDLRRTSPRVLLLLGDSSVIGSLYPLTCMIALGKKYIPMRYRQQKSRSGGWEISRVRVSHAAEFLG